MEKVHHKANKKLNPQDTTNYWEELEEFSEYLEEVATKKLLLYSDKDEKKMILDSVKKQLAAWEAIPVFTPQVVYIQLFQENSALLRKVFRQYAHLIKDALNSSCLNTDFFVQVANLFISKSYQKQKDELNDIDFEKQIKANSIKSNNWRQHLKVGDFIDIKNVQYTVINEWTMAQIISISGEQVTLKLFDLMDYYSPSKQTLTISKFSPQLGQYKSYSRDTLEWKQTLQVGDVVEAFHTSNWTLSTILDIKTKINKNGSSEEFAKIGYRYYVRGVSGQDNKDAFVGRESRSDKWIILGTSRIQKLHTYFSYLSGMQQQPLITNQYEELVPPEADKLSLFALPVPGQINSRLYFDFINELGRAGSISFILDFLNEWKDKEYQQSYSLQFQFLYLMTQIQRHFNLAYAQEVCPKLICITTDLITHYSPRIQIGKISKGATIPYFFGILLQMFQRFHEPHEAIRQLNHLQLKVSLSLLDSQDWSQRELGLEILCDVIFNNDKNLVKMINADYLANWFEQNQIFEKSLRQNNEPYNQSQRILAIIKFLSHHNRFTNDHFQKLLKFKMCNSMDIVFHKIIIKMKPQLTLSQKREVFNAVVELEQDKLMKNDFDFLYALSIDSYSSLKEKFLNYIWGIVVHSNQLRYPSQIISAIQVIVDKDLPLSIKALTQDPYEEVKEENKMDGGFDESSAANKMIWIVIENFKSYNSMVRKLISQNYKNLSERLCKTNRVPIYILDDHFPHDFEIKYRLSLLKHILISNEMTLSEEQKKEMDVIFKNYAIVDADKTQYQAFMRSLINSTGYDEYEDFSDMQQSNLFQS